MRASCSLVAAGVKSSTSGEAFLIREDGTIVFSQRGVGGQAQFFAADLFRERMKSYKAGDPQFRLIFSARDQAGRYWSASRRASWGPGSPTWPG